MDADTETAPPQPDTADEDRIVDRVIDKVLAALSSRNVTRDESPADEPESVAAQVRAAVDKIRADEAEQRTASAIMVRVRLSAASWAVPEKRPREFRKPTEFMRWATEADR